MVPAPGDQGIRPADGGWNGFTIAGEGPGPGWQWSALVPALGTDLVFALQDDETRATYVMEDIGEDDCLFRSVWNRADQSYLRASFGAEQQHHACVGWLREATGGCRFDNLQIGGTFKRGDDLL